MEISNHASENLLEMRVKGMLDNQWADHLAAAIDEVVRQGSHRVVVNLAGVTYMSSAGIAALVRSHKQLQAIRGFFGVCEPSKEAREVLRLTGLAKMLICDLAQLQADSPSAQMTTMPEFRVANRSGVAFELYDIAPRQQLACRLIGHPGRLGAAGFAAEDCSSIPFPASTFGLGLGAFGVDFADCRSRFGELLAVAGAAVHLPTHGNSAPDYQLAAGSFVPDAKVLYGLACEGRLAQMARFEPSEDAEMQTVPLSVLLEQCLEMAESNLAGVVIVAESAGLVGAALRRSPALATASSAALFDHPGIREWISFSPERTFQRSLALAVGVVSRGAPAGALAAHVRPLNAAGTLFGHLHAAAFSYRPLKKGRLDLDATVAALFESEDIQGLLHLLCDDRSISGAGESEFVRGACWIGPIGGVR